MVANKNDNQIRVFINQGNGVMAVAPGQMPLTMGAQAPVSVTIGDINQDNLPDIAVAEQQPVLNNPTDYRISIYFNLGNGLFSARLADSTESIVSTYSCTQPSSILFNDTNNDGLPDLVISCTGTNQILMMINMGKLNIRFVPLPTEATPGHIAIADLNGDGFGDLMVPCAGPTNGAVDIFLNKLGAGFEGQTYLSEPASCAGANQVAVADYQSSGHLDVDVSGTGCLGVLLNQSQ